MRHVSIIKDFYVRKLLSTRNHYEEIIQVNDMIDNKT